MEITVPYYYILRAKRPVEKYESIGLLIRQILLKLNVPDIVGSIDNIARLYRAYKIQGRECGIPKFYFGSDIVEASVSKIVDSDFALVDFLTIGARIVYI